MSPRTNCASPSSPSARRTAHWPCKAYANCSPKPKRLSLVLASNCDLQFILGHSWDWHSPALATSAFPRSHPLLARETGQFTPGVCQEVWNPLGVGGLALHEWAFNTKTFQRMHGKGDGTTGVDDDFAARGFSNVGAWILGRNMFGPVRGPWPDLNWKGWWGDTPPYHTAVFVLTHHARESVAMAGGTTFHFVTDGIESALERAIDAANGKDVRLGGGVATIKQFVRARQVDELRIAVAPVLLGSGERLFADIDLPALGYRCVEHVTTQNATHVVIQK